MLHILFSGGLDSYIAHRYAEHLHRPHELIRVNLGQPYNEAEEIAIEKLGLKDRVVTLNLPVIHPRWGNVPDNTRIEIPGRNLLLAVVSMMLGADEIWLVSLKGEMTYRAKDKNPTFLKLVSGLGSFVFQDHQGELTVGSPFEDLSKLDIVKMALDMGVTFEELKTTSSCLAPMKVGEEWINCGNCKVCVRRAGIFRQLGYDEKYFREPFTSDVGKAEIHKCRTGYYEDCRAQEILGAL